MQPIEQHGISSVTVHMGGTDWLKRELLFYDKIGLLYLDQGIYMLLHGPHPREGRAIDLQFLQDRGAIYEPKVPQSAMSSEITSALSDAEEAQRRFQDSLERNRKHTGGADQTLVDMRDVQAHLARAISIELSSQAHTIATPIISPKNFSTPLQKDKSAQVARVLLENFPLPSETTPFETILDLREDAEFVQKRDALRAWIRRLDGSMWNENQLREEVLYLLNEYQQYMKIQKIKYEIGTLEGLIKFGADVAESLVKLKIGDLVESGFSLFRESAHLMEAELTAPGRELAYITSLKQRFRA